MSKVPDWTRQPGFYWVTLPNTTPIVGFCWGRVWSVMDSDKMFRDSDFELIDERRILPPPYQEMKANSTIRTKNT